MDEEFTADVSGRFAARVLEERVGEGVADRWPEERSDVHSRSDAVHVHHGPA